MENIIIKYLTNSANAEELDVLNEWIKIPLNKKMFKEFVETQYVINYSLNNPDSNVLIEQLLFKINNDKNKTIRLKRFKVLKYAAMFVGTLLLSYYATTFYKNSDQNDIVISNTDVVLKLDNGNVKVISNNGNEKILNKNGEIVGTQSGNELNYSDSNSSEKELRYNELLVPYGRIFDVILSDGTKVKLNAGSSIKYPVKFVNGGNRQVFLKGEAYFDVTKDAKHPFIVSTKDINIRVLGTQFNVSAYNEDKAINTVLVEGSVSVYKSKEVYNATKASLLKPGFKAQWDKNNKNITIDKVDVSLYTAWINGKLVFKNNPFSEIKKKLERKYNVTIINNNSSLEKNTFSAVFDIETVEEVMEVLKRGYGIEYTIKQNQITIY